MNNIESTKNTFKMSKDYEDPLRFIAITTVLILIGSVVQSVGLVNAQNSSASNASIGSASKTTMSSTGNKTIIITPASPTKSSSTVYNKTGFNNMYALKINGKTFPIKYSIVGGKLVGLLADKDRTTVVAVLNPSSKGGNMTTEIPRQVMDSKGTSNADTKYQIKIDGKGVDYKEVANNANARVLSINFSKDNRFMEIIETQMVS